MFALILGLWTQITIIFSWAIVLVIRLEQRLFTELLLICFSVSILLKVEGLKRCLEEDLVKLLPLQLCDLADVEFEFEKYYINERNVKRSVKL